MLSLMFLCIATCRHLFQFEDTKYVIRSRKSTERHYNGKKKEKSVQQNTTKTTLVGAVVLLVSLVFKIGIKRDRRTNCD
jgi:hypothetical protein